VLLPMDQLRAIVMRFEEMWARYHFFCCGPSESVLIPRYRQSNLPVEVKEPQKISKKR
jgi:hypothetical protein